MKNENRAFSCALAKEMESYLLLRQSQGHQARRERHHLVSLDQFLCENDVRTKNLTAEIVEGWLETLSGAMNVNTKIVYISHYSQFAKYLQTLKIPAFIPERPCADQLYAPYIFSQNEIARLTKAVDHRAFKNPCDKTAQLQFPMILRLLCGCGLRLDEALGLRTGSVELDAAVLLVRGGKGNKDRLVPMDATLTNIFRHYLRAAEKISAEDALVFESSKGAQRSQHWARAWFNYALEKSGIQKPDLPRNSRNICLHCLRHTFAVESLRRLLRAGVDPYDALEWLAACMGHSHTEGTQRYLHMTTETGQDILDKTQDYSAGMFPEVPA